MLKWIVKKYSLVLYFLKVIVLGFNNLKISKVIAIGRRISYV